MTYMGAEQVMVGLGVEQMLAARTTEFEAIDTGLSTRVFEDVAPPNTPYPFIVWYCLSPPRDVRGVGTIRVMVDTLYVVKAVGQGDSYAPLAPIAREIDAAMTSSTGIAVGDGLVLTSVREQQHSRTTVEGGTQFRHLGGEFRLQARAEP